MRVNSRQIRQRESLLYCILPCCLDISNYVYTELWDYKAIKSSLRTSDHLCLFTFSLTGEALLITREHFHLSFTSPLPIVIQARFNWGNPYEIIAFTWIYSCHSLFFRSKNAPLRIQRGFSIKVFICSFLELWSLTLNKRLSSSIRLNNWLLTLLLSRPFIFLSLCFPAGLSLRQQKGMQVSNCRAITFLWHFDQTCSY